MKGRGLNPEHAELLLTMRKRVGARMKSMLVFFVISTIDTRPRSRDD
jgi:hypothetical protein